jgi:DNA-binding FrmR family transcriptional regulator
MRVFLIGGARDGQGQVTPDGRRSIYPSRVWYQGTAMHAATKIEVTKRLRRIEGQVGGLLRMVEYDRYCVDVLTQINAVRAALHKVEEKILHDHVSHCVADAFAAGDATEQRHKVEELITTIERMTR